MEESKLEEGIRKLFFLQLEFEIKNDPSLLTCQKVYRLEQLKYAVQDTEIDEALRYLIFSKKYNFMDLESCYREIVFKEEIIKENGL